MGLLLSWTHYVYHISTVYGCNIFHKNLVDPFCRCASWQTLLAHFLHMMHWHHSVPPSPELDLIMGAMRVWRAVLYVQNPLPVLLSWTAVPESSAWVIQAWCQTHLLAPWAHQSVQSAAKVKSSRLTAPMFTSLVEKSWHLWSPQPYHQDIHLGTILVTCLRQLKIKKRTYLDEPAVEVITTVAWPSLTLMWQISLCVVLR